MSIFDTLLKQGFVPQGVAPKNVTQGETGADATFGVKKEEGSLSKILRTIEKTQLQFKEKQQEEADKIQKKNDMYTTLRDAGYSTKKAYEAVSKLKFPSAPPEKTPVKERKEEASLLKTTAETAKVTKETKLLTTSKKVLEQRILNKVADGGKLTAGEQKVYDETIKKTTQGKIKAKILQKKAAGEELTKGEQDIYDDVLKRKDIGSLLESVLLQKFGDKQASEGDDDFVEMIKPDGSEVEVHKDDVAKALKKKYKRK